MDISKELGKKYKKLFSGRTVASNIIDRTTYEAWLREMHVYQWKKDRQPIR